MGASAAIGLVLLGDAKHRRGRPRGPARTLLTWKVKKTHGRPRGSVKYDARVLSYLLNRVESCKAELVRQRKRDTDAGALHLSAVLHYRDLGWSPEKARRQADKLLPLLKVAYSRAKHRAK